MYPILLPPCLYIPVNKHNLLIRLCLSQSNSNLSSMSRKTLHFHLILVGLATQALVKKISLILEKWVSDKAVSQGMECFIFWLESLLKFVSSVDIHIHINYKFSFHTLNMQLRKPNWDLDPIRENLLKLFENRAHKSLKNRWKWRTKSKFGLYLVWKLYI